MTVGEKLRELRLARHMTLEEVGKKVGVGKSTVRKWETGDIASMKEEKVKLLAAALGTTPMYLMGLEEEAETISPARQALLDAVDDMDEEQLKKLLQIIEAVKGM